MRRPLAARRYRPGPSLRSFPPRSSGGCISMTEKTSAAAAAADAGLVFYNYGCHRIIYEIDIKNKPAPRAVRGAPLASAGRNFIDLRQFS